MPKSRQQINHFCHSSAVLSAVSPLNLTSSTSLAFSMMSPLGLKVWQGQCTLISRPRFVSGVVGTRAQRCKDLTFIPRGPHPSSQLKQDSLVRCATTGDGRKSRGVVLTSVHQPLPHGLSYIKGDPLRRSFGKYVLAPNVALFGFRVVFLEDLRGKMKM